MAFDECHHAIDNGTILNRNLSAMEKQLLKEREASISAANQNIEETSDGDYTADLVRLHDGNRWLAARYGDELARQQLYSVNAWRLELRGAVANVKEAPLGEIRLQWWREAFQEVLAGDSDRVRAHPVVRKLARHFQSCNHAHDDREISKDNLARLMNEAITARAQLLYDAPFEDVTALYEWVCAAEAVGGNEFSQELAYKAGGLYGMVAHSWRGQENISMQDIHEFVIERYHAMRVNLKQIAPAYLPAFLHIALTPLYLKGVTTGPAFALQRQWRLFICTLMGRW